MSTKENILSEALHLFAQNGYEAVSMLHGIMEHRCEGGHRILPHSLLDRGSVRHAG